MTKKKKRRKSRKAQLQGIEESRKMTDDEWTKLELFMKSGGFSSPLPTVEAQLTKREEMSKKKKND